MSIFGTMGLVAKSGLSLTAPALAPLAVWKMDEGSGPTAYNAMSAPVVSDNLLGAPERVFGADSVAAWTTTGTTVTDDFGANRNGLTVASRLEIAGSSGNYISQTTIVPTTATYTLSIDVKSNTGVAQKFRMLFGGNISSDFIVPATGWTRFAFSASLTAGSVWCVPVWQVAAGDAIDLLIYGAKLNVGASATAYVAPVGDLQLGKTAGSTDSTRPGWISSGLAFQGSKFGLALIEPNVSASQLSVYAVARWTGTPVLAGYDPLVSEDFSAPAGNTFQLFALRDAAGNGPGFAFRTARTPYAYATYPNDGSWHVFAGTYDGTTLRFYMDDAELSTVVSVGLSAIDIRRAFVANFNNAAFWPGDIGLAGLYTTGHTAAQVASVGGLMRAAMLTRSVTMTPLAKYVAWEGDSMSDPVAIPSAFPSLAPKLSTLGAQGRVFAVTGSTVADLTTRAAAVDATYAATRSRNILHVLVGRNDLLGVADPTAFLAALRTYCRPRQAAGFKVGVGTILPSIGSQINTARAIANPLIRSELSASTPAWDFVTDFAADPTMGPDAAASDTTYYSDGTHPTPAGMAILAGIAQAAIDAL